MNTSKYTIGQYVILVDDIDARNECDSMEDGSFKHHESGLVITEEMMTEFGEWYDNQISSIDENGNYEFEDFNGFYPECFICGLSHDQRIENEK